MVVWGIGAQWPGFCRMSFAQIHKHNWTAEFLQDLWECCTHPFSQLRNKRRSGGCWSYQQSPRNVENVFQTRITCARIINTVDSPCQFLSQDFGIRVKKPIIGPKEEDIWALLDRQIPSCLSVVRGIVLCKAMKFQGIQFYIFIETGRMQWAPVVKSLSFGDVLFAQTQERFCP